MSGIQFQTREEFEEAVRGVVHQEIQTYLMMKPTDSEKIYPFLDLQDSQDTEWLKNLHFFELHKAEFTARYPGKYVAVFNEEVLGTDDSLGELVGRLYSKYGVIPLYAGSTKVEPIDSMPSYIECS